MEKAQNLATLKELINRLGLKEDRRQSPRYRVEIMGNYHIDQATSCISQGRCWLVDISRGGLAIKLKDATVHAGMIIHLQFLMETEIIDITTEVVHLEQTEDGYLVGVKALNEHDDLISRLFP